MSSRLLLCVAVVWRIIRTISSLGSATTPAAEVVAEVTGAEGAVAVAAEVGTGAAAEVIVFDVDDVAAVLIDVAVVDVAAVADVGARDGTPNSSNNSSSSREKRASPPCGEKTAAPPYGEVKSARRSEMAVSLARSNSGPPTGGNEAVTCLAAPGGPFAIPRARACRNRAFISTPGGA